MHCCVPTAGCWVGLLIASAGLGQNPPVTEASGITRHGDTLLIVTTGTEGFTSEFTSKMIPGLSSVLPKSESRRSLFPMPL